MSVVLERLCPNTLRQVGVALPKQQAVPWVSVDCAAQVRILAGRLVQRCRRNWRYRGCCCCGRDCGGSGRKLSGGGCHCFESVFVLQYGLSCWIATVELRSNFKRRACYLTGGFPSRCIFHLTRFVPRRSAQTKVAKRPFPSFLYVEFYWISLYEPCICSHSFHPSFLTHQPLMIFLLQPVLQAQTRVQAAGVGTATKHPRTHVSPSHYRIRSLPSRQAK